MAEDNSLFRRIDRLSSLDLHAIPEWRTVDKREVIKRGKWVTLEEHKVDIGGGNTIPDWTWVKSTDFVNVAAVTPEGEWLVFQQTKYAIGYRLKSNSLAPVGGILEEGEDPLEAAKRELQEETGYASEKWIKVGTGVADANRGCNVGHLYLAVDAKYVGKVESDDLEVQHGLLLTTPQLAEALENGFFMCHSWQATMASSLLYHYKHGRVDTLP